MTQTDDLNIIREAYRAWNEGSGNWLMHPDIEWITPAEVPGGGTFVGKEATAGFLSNFEGTNGVLNLSFQIQEIIPATGQYLVISRAEGSGASGIAVPAHDWFHLIRLENGMVRRAELFLDRNQALEAAGLST
jgi:ketosteroid isomerase-like protein